MGELIFLNPQAELYMARPDLMERAPSDRAELVTYVARHHDMQASLELQEMGYTDLPLHSARQDVLEAMGLGAVLDELRTFYNLSDLEFDDCLAQAYELFAERIESKIEV